MSSSIISENNNSLHSYVVTSTPNHKFRTQNAVNNTQNLNKITEELSPASKLKQQEEIMNSVNANTIANGTIISPEADNEVKKRVSFISH